MPRTSRASGNPALIAKIASKSPAAIKQLGTRIDVSRFDTLTGRALLDIADWLLAQPDDVIRDYLPALAIAAARESQYAAAIKRARADRVLGALVPYVERSAWVADLVARSGCHLVRVHGAKAEAARLYALARRCTAIADNPYLASLAGSVS